MISDIYSFGPFRADLRRRVLEREGTQVALSGKAFEILAALLERQGEVLDKDTLMKTVWPDAIVEENNLTVNMSWLRKALGETPSDPQYILTIPGRGYRFIAAIETESAETSAVVTKKKRWLPYLIAAIALLLVVGGGARWYRSRAVIPMASNCIAVLPFQVLGSDSSNAYLGAGLTDSLITRLTNLRGVTVRPMSSVLRLAGKDPFAAGRDVGADTVLDGKVQQREGAVRVSVQMLRMKDGASLWAETFDEKLTSLFALEDAISARVAASLAQNLGAGKGTTHNAEAYQNYLRGRYFASRYTEEGYRKGLDYLRQAIAADPGYALAYSGLADSYYDASNMLLPPREAMTKAKAAAERAVELDPALAEAHVSLGIVASKFDWDWPAAEREFQTALRLNPNSAAAHLWYGLYRAALGDTAAGETGVRRAQELDPLSSDNASYLATVLYWSRKYDAALDQVQKALAFDSTYFPGYVTKAWILEARGQTSEAVTACQKAVELADTPWSEAALARALALAGRGGEARHKLGALEKRSEREFVSGYDIAAVHIALEQKDEAFAWLEKAFAQRAEWLGYLKIDPQLDNLRTDPRFRDLLRRLALDR